MAASRRDAALLWDPQNGVIYGPFFGRSHCTNTHNMQRLLLALCLGAAAAFAPQVWTQNSLLRLHANPIDIYSTATARNYDFACSWERQQLDYVALPIVALPEARTSKLAT